MKNDFKHIFLINGNLFISGLKQEQWLTYTYQIRAANIYFLWTRFCTMGTDVYCPKRCRNNCFVLGNIERLQNIFKYGMISSN